MTKRMIIMLIAVGLVFGGVFGFLNFRAAMIKKFMSAMPPPPQTVSTVTAAMQEWQPQIEAGGSLPAVNGADLAFEVSGVVKGLHFKSRDDLVSGGILLTLRRDDDIAKLQPLQGH